MMATVAVMAVILVGFGELLRSVLHFSAGYQSIAGGDSIGPAAALPPAGGQGVGALTRRLQEGLQGAGPRAGPGLGFAVDPSLWQKVPY
jgi:hypothetical protein